MVVQLAMADLMRRRADRQTHAERGERGKEASGHTCRSSLLLLVGAVFKPKCRLYFFSAVKSSRLMPARRRGQRAPSNRNARKIEIETDKKLSVMLYDDPRAPQSTPTDLQHTHEGPHPCQLPAWEGFPANGCAAPCPLLPREAKFSNKAKVSKINQGRSLI